MAGRKGERFWPESREDRPKQMLRLFSDDTMIELTEERLVPMIPAETSSVEMFDCRTAATILFSVTEKGALQILASLPFIMFEYQSCAVVNSATA